MPNVHDRPAAVRDVVVIGASAGGVSALRTLVSRLPRAFPGSVLIVLHTGAFPSRLPDILAGAGPNPARFAEDGSLLRKGTIVVAPPDQHLLVCEGLVRLTRGPKEHHTRPAIDPLFRTAALWGGPRIVGVVLSGRNDDGTAGLQAIKSCGGIAVAQDPADAEEAVMPRSAMLHTRVDRCLPVQRIADALVELVGQPAGLAVGAPDNLAQELAVSLGEGDVMNELHKIGKPSAFVCPDCNGPLFELVNGTPTRYRCHTGHAFTLRTLQQAQAEATEAALWTAIRALQEKETLLRKVSELDRKAGDERHADKADAEAQRICDHIASLRQLVEEE
jgi:two-component system chemotaxis response regulator CheB